MTTATLTTPPRLPHRTRPHGTRASWTPPGGWTRPTPAVLRAMEAALVRWAG